jgi:hypothetical protein
MDEEHTPVEMVRLMLRCPGIQVEQDVTVFHAVDILVKHAHPPGALHLCPDTGQGQAAFLQKRAIAVLHFQMWIAGRETRPHSAFHNEDALSNAYLRAGQADATVPLHSGDHLVSRGNQLPGIEFLFCN